MTDRAISHRPDGLREFQSALDALRARQIPAALESLCRAESLGHDPSECGAQRWVCHMLTGDFERAWQESDAIAGRGGPDPHQMWDRQPFAGKRVLIRCLHGFGDAIQFIRYAELLRREAASVVAQTHPEMVSLLRCVRSLDGVISWDGECRTSWDQQIEVMELPRVFRTTLETIPARVPYLAIESERRLRAEASFLPGTKPRIALQWGSGPWNSDRSIPLSLLLPLCEDSDCGYYSLQRPPHRADLKTPAGGQVIHDISGDSPEIADTAAALCHIDLVITVDTMLAHLAGALGKSVWLLLPWQADWRWMLDRGDSPWYPTMTLFGNLFPATGNPLSRE